MSLPIPMDSLALTEAARSDATGTSPAMSQADLCAKLRAGKVAYEKAKNKKAIGGA